MGATPAPPGRGRDFPAEALSRRPTSGRLRELIKLDSDEASVASNERRPFRGTRFRGDPPSIQRAIP